VGTKGVPTLPTCTGLLFQPPNSVFKVRDIIFHALDLVTVKPLVLRLIDGDLAHELTQVVQPSLDAPEALVALIEPLVRLVEPFIKVFTQRADAVADLA
jgi:hypothetical protein